MMMVSNSGIIAKAVIEKDRENPDNTTMATNSEPLDLVTQESTGD